MNPNDASLSVIICTYNPKLEILKRVLDALQKQSLQKNLWELLLVDNGSTTSFDDEVDLSWHPNARIIKETRPGLAHARVAGIKNAKTNLFVFVDDDNVLDSKYLNCSRLFHQLHPKVGCFGGKSLPVFETEPPDWFGATGIDLGCQDYGEGEYISNYASVSFKLKAYPQKAPIGTGMVISRMAFLAYLDEATTDSERMKLGRKGKALTSGEDNDIILSIIKKGFEIAYVPELLVHHLIPANRYTVNYLKKMAFESNRSWVKVLQIHGINPHQKIAKWTVLPRMFKSYFSQKAWHSPLAFIRWRTSCGTFKGLSEI